MNFSEVSLSSWKLFELLGSYDLIGNALHFLGVEKMTSPNFKCNQNSSNLSSLPVGCKPTIEVLEVMAMLPGSLPTVRHKLGRSPNLPQHHQFWCSPSSFITTLLHYIMICVIKTLSLLHSSSPPPPPPSSTSSLRQSWP